MINYFKHSEIDKSKWDDCITHSPNGLIYAYSWYLDIASPGWDALVSDNYSSVFPLTHRIKLGIRYIYPPYFIQQLGLFSKKEINGEKLKEFINAIPPHFKFIEYNLNWKNNFLMFGFDCKENLTHHLSLNNNYQKIFSNYSQNLKRNLKKANSRHLTFDTNIEVESLIKIFRQNRGAGISKLTSVNYKILLNLISKARQYKAVEIISVSLNNKTCAGAVFFKSNDKYIFIFSAIDQHGKESAAMPYLIDNFIRQHACTEYVLDFEGSNNPDLARFYKSFGAEPKTYFSIRQNKLPLPFKWMK